MGTAAVENKGYFSFSTFSIKFKRLFGWTACLCCWSRLQMSSVPTRRSALLCVSSTLLASCLGGGLELTYFLFLSICWCRLSALISFNLLLLFFLRESSLYFRCVVVFPAACESLIVIWQPRSDIFRDRGGGGLVHLRGKHLDLVSDLFHLIWMLACARFTVVVTHLYCRWHGWSDVLLWGETIRSLQMSSEWSLQ